MDDDDELDIKQFVALDALQSNRPEQSDARKTRFQCEKCGKKYVRKGNLVSHIEYVHKNNIDSQRTSDHEQHDRSKTFDSIADSQSHSRTQQTDDKPFACNQCEYRGRLKQHLKLHVRRIHDKKNIPTQKYHECDVCGVVFDWKHSLTQHHRLHTGEKPFECEHCGKTFTQKGNLTAHMQCIHEPQRLIHECDVCASLFTNKANLRKHKQYSHGDRVHACDQCDYRARRKDKLKRHKLRHSDERKYICAECGAAFKMQWGLSEHSTVHSDQRPHKCDVTGCGLTYKTRNRLTEHIRLKHRKVNMNYVMANSSGYSKIQCQS